MLELTLALVIGATGAVIGAGLTAAYARRRGDPTYEFIDLVRAVENAKDGRNARPDHMDRAFIEGADAVLGQLLMRPDTGEEEMRMAYSASGAEDLPDPDAPRGEP